jgi:hypothetical protein
MKWLMWFIQNDDHIVIEEVDEMIEITVAIGGSDPVIFIGDNVMDAIDQAMAEFPIPAV